MRIINTDKTLTLDLPDYKTNVNTETEIDWPQVVFDDVSMKAFEKLATRRFNAGVLAEEAVTHVIEGLSEDNWARCKAYKGNAKPATYIHSLASNLIEEFARKRFGRPRPPTWLAEQGELWVQMWKLLCLERQLLPSILDRLCANNGREPAMLTDVARTIKARMPNCGLTAMDHELAEDISVLSDARTTDTPRETTDFNHEHATVSEVILMLRSVLGEEVAESSFSAQSREAAKNYAQAHESAFQDLRQMLALTDEEKVLLRMIFVDGFSKSAASKALGLPSHHAGRIANAALGRIGDALRSTGLSLDDIMGKL